MLETPEGEVIEKAIKFRFFAPNNEIEYETLIQGLRLARELRALEMQVYNNS